MVFFLSKIEMEQPRLNGVFDSVISFLNDVPLPWKLLCQRERKKARKLRRSVSPRRSVVRRWSTFCRLSPLESGKEGSFVCRQDSREEILIRVKWIRRRNSSEAAMSWTIWTLNMAQGRQSKNLDTSDKVHGGCTVLIFFRHHSMNGTLYCSLASGNSEGPWWPRFGAAAGAEKELICAKEWLEKSWFEQRSDWKSTQLESAWCPDSSPFITWSETCDILASQDWFDLFWKRRPEIKGLSIGGKPEKRRPCLCRCAKAGPGDPAADGGGEGTFERPLSLHQPMLPPARIA